MGWSSDWKSDDKLPDLSKATPLEVKQEWVSAASEMLKQYNDQVPEYIKVGAQAIIDLIPEKYNYETRQIQLGNKTILVTVVGDLGLDFCEPGEKDQGWNIYHLPTLACFSSAVPGYLKFDAAYEKETYDYDKSELLRWMARVQENYPTSWQVLRLLTPDNYADNGATAKEIIQKWCLSVKVE